MVTSKIKILSIVAGVAALVATPAVAGKTHKKKAAARDADTTQAQRVPDGKAIYSWDGRYRGWDPDPNIRFQLLRDQNLPHD
jgi:hypothetical protein